MTVLKSIFLGFTTLIFLSYIGDYLGKLLNIYPYTITFTLIFISLLALTSYVAIASFRILMSYGLSNKSVAGFFLIRAICLLALFAPHAYTNPDRESDLWNFSLISLWIILYYAFFDIKEAKTD